MTSPTRVLFIIDSLMGVGGAEMCLLRLTKHLPRHLYECHVLTFHARDGVNSLLHQFECPVYHWPLTNVHNWEAFRVARRLRKLVRDQKIDIVHTFFHTSDLWAGPIAKLSGAKALISSRRDMGILRGARHQVGYRLLRGIFDQVQTVSDSVRRWTIERDGIDVSRTITIHNGIGPLPPASEAQTERFRRAIDISDDTLILTTVANFRHVKGIDVLVRAAALVGKELPGVRVVVAGSFDTTAAGRTYADQVFQLSKAIGADPWMRFLGAVEDVPALLSLSDIFVLPSRSEGLSNALLEAMSAGLPCIATDVGGNPEVIVNGKTGFIVPSDNPELLADRMLRLLQDSQLRRRMGDASRRRASEHFAIEAMTSRVMTCYENVLHQKEPNPLHNRFTHAIHGAVQRIATRVGLNGILRHTLLSNRLLVLCYHNVLRKPPRYPYSYSIHVLAEEFDRHMRFLAKNFHVMSATELIDVMEGRCRLPARSAVVTFDDGYRNGLTVAAPILRTYGVPAIFNVCSGYVSQPVMLWPDEIAYRILNWPDTTCPLPDGRTEHLDPAMEKRLVAAVQVQEHCKVIDDTQRLAYIEKLRSNSPSVMQFDLDEDSRFMSWDDARELSDQGFEIGSHTVSHPILTRLNADRCMDELRTSKQHIEAELRKECRVIAYPNGLTRDADASVYKAAEVAGYRLGFTLQRHLAKPGSPFAVNRINVPGNEPQAVFESRAAGVYVLRTFFSEHIATH